MDIVPTLTSSFISARAWNGKSERTRLIRCADCDFRYFERGLTPAESANYYKGYRDETYRRERSRHEIFYTRRLHDSLSRWMQSPARAQGVADALKTAGRVGFNSVLDYGGSSGYLMSRLQAKEKAIFDLSGDVAQPDVTVISDERAIPQGSYDLIICAQTLEHCSDVLSDVTRIERALAPGGVLYLELPNEIWRENFKRSRLANAVANIVVSCAIRSPIAQKILDLLFTGIRTQFHILPSIGFVAMREHLNYFSLESLVRLAKNFQLRVLRAVDGEWPYIIAEKLTTTGSGSELRCQQLGAGAGRPGRLPAAGRGHFFSVCRRTAS